MNDIRRTVLWIVFGFAAIMLWDKWQIHHGRSALFFPEPPAVVQTADTSSPAGNGVPQSKVATPPAGGDGSGSVVPAQQGDSAVVPAQQQVTVSTDVMHLTFNTTGGVLMRAELPKFASDTDKSRPFVLLDENAMQTYLAQTGLIGGDFPTHQTPMRVVTSERTLQDGQDRLALRFESEETGGLKLAKTYTLLRGSYIIEVQHEVMNVGSATLAPKLYLQLLRDGNKAGGNTTFYSTFTGPALYTDDLKYTKISFEDIEKNKAKLPVGEVSNGYAAMVQHYFVGAWLLDEGVPREMFARKVGNNLYSVGMITPVGEMTPGSSRLLHSRLYVGPQNEKVLESLEPGLELVKDYGWLTILSKPLYWLLDKIHSLLGNWGWSIVVLVILLKIVLYWPNAKAYASMAKMKALNPRIAELRERYKNNTQQQQQEMMRLYREEKVNPVGGCLPIVLQIPIFIALYWVLLASVELRGAPWILWVQDLSVRDPYFILPILMTASSLLQVWLNPKPADPTQAKMMWIMPLAFSFMFFFFPAGLVLYWLTNNILSILQQWIINKRLGV